MQFIIADDHPLFRGALRQVLSSLPEEAEILEVGDFDAAKKLVVERDDIDLLLLDLTMPGGTGLSGLVTLKALQPALPIIIVSATDDTATIRHAVELGASGFISKSASMETIGEAVHAVIAGDIWTPSDIDLDQAHDPEIEALINKIRTLTPQQTRVLTMLAEGLLNKQIAYELNVSEATVKAHVSAVLQKLGVDSRTQAVILLSRIGNDALTSEAS
ncbi:bacterial regulatory, luxR family protein [Ochrobactrum quorumnocens]|jgi:DNA-binding NarL/FixJ family response regulator|uniref:Flagellar transcriptional regulator FtcR n=1 Tax=Ochrobactrum quorumnocens TaxID=271865 RepID=A0A248UFU2_9HYPH|nr:MULTISPECIES: response regulator transcription factor [Brucella/Ochrobactrum group]ASV85410.1 bacterial regulatory, luxR family protein [[Ochrobactrum] quorumnocens]MCV9906593.1 response regulator transcription factor [Brucella sp. HL-2]MDH7793519.1 DNA-binding NarL/FixJ family response regulator [Ochrobactrum sp. AN78]